ncbi:magnesium/cobalt transporter CorA [Geomonas subterranea]|uniref:Magnesium transport protein CorA n=1 Tax=Geomonas subterranea TaxID=2847989 RepID=A0ABX8LHQ1_9BACT|nr:magnesium/cobalt transporter CorA [Geomonas subterranea]QXE89753.1 magnesium/cobalt transporter CorA [Geomonas subterranea]QXM08128.1 magnesium/cobalt transporter CorA [Geomonas subterranea]
MTSIKHRSKKAGLAPGTLIHMGRDKGGATRVDLVQYDETRLEKRPVTALDECLIKKGIPGVTWINVEGLSDVEVLRHFGSCYGIHPLVLEDILATDQRPKAADYGEYLYVVLKMLGVDDGTGEIKSEQVSLVLGQNYLISFQEGLEGDVFEQVRARLVNEKARLRAMGPDFLLHALLDVIVDHYFLILEKLADRIEDVEDELIDNPTTATVQTIYRLKRQMLFLHKAFWPLREVASSLQRRDSQLIRDTTVIYLRDLYDHTVQVLDTLETLREMLSGMLDIYLSSVSNRLNEVMKVLTIIATIFMPLSFVVGWYGMNFKHMPELEWSYGYPVVFVICLVLAGGMLVYFKNKRWL